MAEDAAFRTALIALRRKMGRQIAVPSCAEWRIERSPRTTVVVRLSVAELDRNLQEDRAAVPFFAWSLAWWFERFGVIDGEGVAARIELDGPLPDTPHGHRSMFVLHELQQLLPERVSFVPPLEERWPASPVLNEAKADRDGAAHPERGGEHAIEVAFTRQADLIEQFAAIDAVDSFERQLPVGVFDGEVLRSTRWSPSGKSQIDLWARSADRTTIHLFELKDRGNTGLGIVPEAFWYTRLVHAVRVNSFAGRTITGGGAAMDLVRGSSRIAMWLLVQDLHPLVLLDGGSPLSELNAAMRAQDVAIGVLPYSFADGRVELNVAGLWR